MAHDTAGSPVHAPSPRPSWVSRTGLRTFWALVLACLGTLSVARPAAADSSGRVAPEVSRRAEAAATARGPAVYAALRRLWQSWETTDANQVEASLAAIGQDPKLVPSARVYAQLLEAYARRRRGDLRGARRRIAKLGFVSEVWLVGPFDNDNRTGLEAARLVERELDEPIDPTRSYGGKERAVKWRISPDVHHYGVLDIGSLVRPQRDQCTYAATFVESPDRREATLWVGVTGAYKLWFNREEVGSDTGYRELDADRRAVTVTMEAGMNRITVKVCGDESPPALALRVGAADGGLSSGLKVAATEAASRTYASRVKAAGRSNEPAPRRRQPVLGPLDAFEAQVGEGKGSPTQLEDYASYLSITGGEADASHAARDLSRRAAEAAPTVGRLLLAASLAEDRNGARGFLEQADALAKSPRDRVDWLIARARWLRAGPNPREAFSLYGDVLAIDPTNVQARLGQVDLYVEAGLPRTALTTLQAAVERHPHCVALLRNLAGRLRVLGRDTEASEVEARYAAYRFDDGVYLKGRLDLAVARRDAAAVKQSAGRLLQTEPGSLWAHGAVAKAYLGLGDRDQAIAYYQKGLTIAPEDVETMQKLAELYGLMGKQGQQVALLRKILRIVPQAKGVRAHLEHIVPSGERQDEKYAWPPEKFLAQRAITDDDNEERVLRDLTVTKVFDNGLSTKFRQVVFQPLTDEAAARSRQYGFSYHADRQVVTLRAAKVYRQDGRVDEAIESGEAAANDPSINMYTLVRTFYVQFPRLEVGDVVELQYRIEDVAIRNEMSDYFGEVSFLQSTEPIASAEYVLIAPKKRKLRLSVGPGDKPLANLKREVKEKGDERIYRFVATDVPALATEPRMPRLGELLAHVHVSTFADWSEVGQWYAGLAREKLDADDDVRKLARKLTAGLTTDRQKVAAIYGYAAGKVRYVALELGIEGIRPRRAALTLARGWGDCKDKATLIVSMLREVGIDAELVLVRTGLRGGFDSSTASLAPFDHAIAYIPSLDLYLDGTAEDTGTAELPAMDRDSMALRITNQGGKLVELPQPEASQSRDRRSYVIDLAKDGGLRFEVEVSNQGVDAPGWRRRYRDPSSQRERVAADLAAALGPVVLEKGKRGLTVTGTENIESVVKLSATGTADAKKQGVGWRVPAGPGFRMVARFAGRPSRTHDVLIGPRRSREEVWEIRIPAGMKASALPKATKVETPFGTFVLEVEKKSNQVVLVTTNLTLEQARIRPGQYAAWRRFCQAVDAAAGPVLVVQ